VSSPTVVIERVERVDDELIRAFARLMPQLSSSPPPDDGQLSAVVSNPHTFLFVARSQSGEILGSLTLATFCLATGVRAWIEDVVVDEPARGRGVASALVDHAVREARRAGASTVDLTSRPSREVANRLYRALGFSPRETNVYRLMLGG
jgi:ribosomal protein S18 acetylase RimI-like enzyme